jgi:hypothetical protein
MNVIIKKLFNQTGIETGAILIAVITNAVNAQQKAQIEKQLNDYAFEHLYPGQGLNIYSDVNTDSPAIVVIKNINSLPDTTVTI